MGDSPPAPQVRGMNCPNCGAALTIRAFEHTLTVVCVDCLSVLDAKDPNLRILQEFRDRERVRPKIPLGVRGKVHGVVYEVVGFLERTILVEELPYRWQEYLLFNPYKGFRYLTEYNGHWNDVKTLKSVPERWMAGNKPAARVLGETYKHFQTATAEITFVMGEFPWQARVGDKARVMDYISPPRILSGEMTEEETTWSLGEYVSGGQVWEAFKLPGSPPPSEGVFANQPSPHSGAVWSLWQMCLLLLVITMSLALAVITFSSQEEVFRQTYTATTPSGAEAAFTTPVFELQGRPSNVELSIRTDVANNWAYFDLALINEGTGQAYNFGREVSYYFGRDSDGQWSEGRPGDRAVIPTVPAGRYYVLVQPELAPQTRHMNYELRIRRDVPAFGYFGIVVALLLVPPVFASLRAHLFEQSRWVESDYAPKESASDEEDDD